MTFSSTVMWLTIEMLKHHGQPGAQQAQLVLVGHLQLAVFIRTRPIFWPLTTIVPSLGFQGS